MSGARGTSLKVVSSIALAGVGVALAASLGPAAAAAPNQASPSPSSSPTPSPGSSPTPGGPPADVFLAFASPEPSNPDDPCRTGTTSKTMEVGENHDVIVCTFDETGRPAPTEPAGFRLGWELDSDDPSRPAVAFNPDPPPADTAGPAATAQAGLDGVAPGETSIRVTLLDSSGLVVDTFSVSVRVLFNGDRIVATDVTARVGRRSIRGTVRAAQPECERGRSVKLFRRVRRVGELVGIAESNARGRWRVVTGRTPGVYYARAVAASRTDEEWGDILSCLRGDGKNVRRR